MTDNGSQGQDVTLREKLMCETARIEWSTLQPFFARGQLIRVSAHMDLVDVAVCIAEDDKDQLANWMAAGSVGQANEEQAMDWQERDPELWAVVVAPWVLVQERTAGH